MIAFICGGCIVVDFAGRDWIGLISRGLVVIADAPRVGQSAPRITTQSAFI